MKLKDGAAGGELPIGSDAGWPAGYSWALGSLRALAERDPKIRDLERAVQDAEPEALRADLPAGLGATAPALVEYLAIARGTLCGTTMADNTEWLRRAGWPR